MASPFAMDSHIEAHLVQTSEHISHMRIDISELRIMKSAHIWHICAQSIIVFIILESQLPISRHFISIAVQVR
ncbi:MAG: hypothetical protein JO319_05730 [Acidobacteriaceae bacterium]|nr:hypothetical protein [Acidobacteriaceae bacterium]